MTMVVIDAQPDRARIMSDSLAYDDGGRNLHADDKPKVTALDGLDAAVTSRGSVALGFYWRRVASMVAANAADFDELTDRSEAALRLAVEMLKARPGTADLDPYGQFAAHAYMVGWSPRHERFKAYVISTAGGIGAPVDISDEFHVVPAPPDLRATDAERQVYEQRAEQTGKGWTLPGREVPEAPAETGGWVDLAKAIHRGRSVSKARMVGHRITGDEMQVRVGGSVHLTTLTPGRVTQEEIHAFDRDDFYAMVVNSFHPVGQLAPCVCGSSRRFRDCHITLWQRFPCHCGSGDTLEDCCKLDPASIEACETLDEYPQLADVGDWSKRGKQALARAGLARAGVGA